MLDFASEKELIAQIGHSRDAWPVVIAKELLDNASMPPRKPARPR